MLGRSRVWAWVDGFKAAIKPSPTSVSEIASAVAIAGQEFTCALLADSTVECWVRRFRSARERLGLDGQSGTPASRWRAPSPGSDPRHFFWDFGWKGGELSQMASTGSSLEPALARPLRSSGLATVLTFLDLE